MRVVINRCFGGFGISDEAIKMYLTLKEIPFTIKTITTYGFTEQRIFTEQDGEQKPFYGMCIDRTDEILVQVVETLGTKANDDCAELKVVEIPDDVEWYIHEYDGNECINEKHRSWS
jgi:hypothetical protein